MKEEEKLLLIERQVEKAHYMMAQAEEMMSLGHTDLAVNRYYYACFHIVQALFLKNGISVRSHSGMILAKQLKVRILSTLSSNSHCSST